MVVLSKVYSSQTVSNTKKSLQETNAAARKARISAHTIRARTAAYTATQMRTKAKQLKDITTTKKEVPFWATANPNQTNG
jgi:hypothetical protein